MSTSTGFVQKERVWLAVLRERLEPTKPPLPSVFQHSPPSLLHQGSKVCTSETCNVYTRQQLCTAADAEQNLPLPHK